MLFMKKSVCECEHYCTLKVRVFVIVFLSVISLNLIDKMLIYIPLLRKQRNEFLYYLGTKKLQGGFNQLLELRHNK